MEQPWKLEQVLRAEVHAIREVPLKEEAGPGLYRKLNSLDLTALCLSGGGIRSSAFSLGVIQALASHPQCKRDDSTVAESSPQSLLTQFDYMSTVSGGGYIGSWLSAWRRWHPFSEISPSLIGRPAGNERAPHALEWLRSYSNYLTPKTGLTSADTWTALGLTLRNLLLNWFVIVTPICALILGVKLAALTSDWLAQWDSNWFAKWNLDWMAQWDFDWVAQWRLKSAGRWTSSLKVSIEVAAGIAGVICFVVAIVKTIHARPAFRSAEYDGPSQAQFLSGTLLWSLLSAIFLVQFFASDYIAYLQEKCSADGQPPPKCDFPTSWDVMEYSFPYYVGGGLVLGALIYLAGWLLGKPQKKHHLNPLMGLISGGAFGTLVASGYYFYLIIPNAGIGVFPINFIHIVFGVPYIFTALMLTEIVFVGLNGHQRTMSDADVEWLGRSFGWFLAIAIAWFTLSFLVLLGAVLVQNKAAQWVDATKAAVPLIAAGGGLITAFFGRSARFPAGKATGTLHYLEAVALPTASALFFAGIIISISYLLDRALLDNPLNDSLLSICEDTCEGEFQGPFVKLVVGFLVAAGLSVVASRYIDINRFSLHGIYRNRLIRAFLGAGRIRTPDRFTGFDFHDDMPMHELWSPPDPQNWRPFHIINIALNTVSSTQLEWQERKAEPFMVSPLHAGSSRIGYRDCRKYGGHNGISLGTAMAISGAAASPNMGYHSNPSVTFLMSMLNVRLGWWLGNPGSRGDHTYRNEGPDYALLPLLSEALGLTTDERPYVYLSDGGHFENLGLYEMVRRRCRFIVVSDASNDPDFSFWDLGNAVRKIFIDLGITIKFIGLDRLRNRSDEPIDGEHIFHAIGEVEYGAADGGGKNGYIVYIKAAYHGIENSGVRAYAAANPQFPHQSTMNQWFAESQFESYRALGFEISQRVLSEVLDRTLPEHSSLKDVVQALYERAKAAAVVPSSDYRIDDSLKGA